MFKCITLIYYRGWFSCYVHKTFKIRINSLLNLIITISYYRFLDMLLLTCQSTCHPMALKNSYMTRISLWINIISAVSTTLCICIINFQSMYVHVFMMLSNLVLLTLFYPSYICVLVLSLSIDEFR